MLGQTFAVGEALELPENLNHYIRNVLRLQPGANVELFDGAGHRYVARIASLDPARVEVVEELDEEAESPCRVTLYQALAKGDHFDLVVEKCTELGVAAVVPLETARTVVRISPAKRESKRERWQRIAEGAARQCGRSVVPAVEAAQSFSDALRHPTHEVEVVLHPHGEFVPLTAAVSEDAADVGIWIGPEGGFTDAEVAALLKRATAVSVGPRILRTETAAIVATALVQHRTGGLE